MVVLIRSNDIMSDPRAMKYINYMEKEGVCYKKIAWDRDGNSTKKEDTVYYTKRAAYNVGGINAAKNKLCWMLFVLHSLIKMKLGKDVLHCCDLDTVFPAILYKSIFNRRIKVIFDVFDWYSATLYNQNQLFLSIFKIMERISIKRSDFIIICEVERIEQIPYQIPDKKLSILPNIPYFKSNIRLAEDEKYSFDNDSITFSYVGGFSLERCLEELLSIAEDGMINLLIAGYGNDRIEKKLKTLKNSPNVKYFGKVKYEDGLSIMYNSDIIYAMYSVVNPNHVYAAPNKYYEAMMLGRPLFTTKGTIVERKVIKNGTGFVSGESKEDIIEVIKTLRKEEMHLKGEAARLLWQNKFTNYTENYMANEYSAMIRI